MNQLKETVAPGEIIPAVQLCPIGNWPKGEIMQHCDRAALEAVVAGWKAVGAKEILMDFEHQSETGKIDSNTEAAAWVSNLTVTDEGLLGDLKFTDKGADAVSNRRLRFLSPVFRLDDGSRPIELHSVALTNTPNIPVRCVLNKAPVETPKKEHPKMDKIKEALGLAPEATDEEVLAKVVELRDANAALNKEKEEAEAARKDAEAEAFAEEHKDVCNKEALKAAYLANKDTTVAMVNGLVKPAKPEQVILNKSGKDPVIANKATRESLAALPPSQRAAFYKDHAKEIDG